MQSTISDSAGHHWVCNIGSDRVRTIYPILRIDSSHNSMDFNLVKR